SYIPSSSTPFNPDMRRDSRNREGSRAVRGHWGRALAEAAALCSTPAFSGYPFPGVERGPTWPHLLVGIHELRPEPHHHPTSPDVVDPFGRGGRRASPLGAHAWNDTQGHTARSEEHTSERQTRTE